MTLKRTRIKRATIRSLRPGEPLPSGEPRRYKNSAGYVRLRWKVGPQQYVEVYEHRLIAGLPAAEVHHRDHSKDNNDASNLVVLSKAEHAKYHGEVAASRSRRWSDWQGERSEAAFQKRQRRLARLEDRRRFLAQMAALHAAGLNTVEIGRVVGRDASNVSRGLRAAGVAPSAKAKSPLGEVSSKVRSVVQARAGMRCEICSANLIWSSGQVHHRLPRGMGGSRVVERHQPQNLLFVCRDCHRMVESRRTEALEFGWLVHAGTDPGAVAVLIGQQRAVYLTTDGRYREVAR